jgi:hypothetical protein
MPLQGQALKTVARPRADRASVGDVRIKAYTRGGWGEAEAEAGAETGAAGGGAAAVPSYYYY